jgi:hypothetical protein
MLPFRYELPVAVLLILGGALACFTGYRLFRYVLAVYGFIVGAMLASSFVGVSNTMGMLAAAAIGGLAGAVIMVFAYFVGVAIVGGGLGALILHLAWAQAARGGEPPTVAVIAAVVAGAALATVLRRYVLIVGTAFGGAWTVILGVLAVLSARASASAHAASAGDAWVLYPLASTPGDRWVPIAWVALGLVGTAMQIGFTARRR